MALDPVRLEDTRAWLTKAGKDLHRAEHATSELSDPEDALRVLTLAREAYDAVLPASRRRRGPEGQTRHPRLRVWRLQRRA